MPATRIEFNAGGLIDGWTRDEIGRIDLQATLEKIEGILHEIAPQATIVVTWENGNDKVFGSWEYASEEAEALEELRNFPWHDFERWGVAS